MAEQTTNWPELAIGLYDKLTGRGAEITYEFQKMSVAVPSGTGDNATGEQCGGGRLVVVVRAGSSRASGLCCSGGKQRHHAADPSYRQY